MHIEFLVEEPSAGVALSNLVPRIVPGVEFRIIPFQGKHDLLSKLSERLRGYSKWLPDNWRIVVLIDEDRQDCNKLKLRLENAAIGAGLTTRTSAEVDAKFQVLNRILVEELEAWFFGDIEALHSAYSKIPPSLGAKRKYRDPDSIGGGTWEALERELRTRGYFKGGLAKIEVAEAISSHMDPDRNHSKSFQVFRDGLREIATSVAGTGADEVAGCG